MLDATTLPRFQAAAATALAATAKRRAFLHDVARGCLTRRGYVSFTLLWLGQTATREQKTEAKDAEAAGLLAWPATGPNITAELTAAGWEAIK
jgi:hypothetical protein